MGVFGSVDGSGAVFEPFQQEAQEIGCCLSGHRKTYHGLVYSQKALRPDKIARFSMNEYFYI